ncbi:MAG: alpha-amylase, partial [Candidatus Kapaibacterium sp.]
ADQAENDATTSSVFPEVLPSLVSRGGWRCTGSFVKSILLLPYLSWLGVNTLYVLPVFEPSTMHAKGSLGSVFAVRDLGAVDVSLAEPLVGMSADEQFRAFIEACHHLGFRVLCEFPLRTTSRDAVWCTEHPAWYYWTKESSTELHPPAFSHEALSRIRRKVDIADWHDLPEPDEDYRTRFVAPPVTVVRDAEGMPLGTSADGSRCRIPGVFADYPPDDSQPLWDDVTYLNLFDHPHFAYPAYNTVRMFDERLRRKECERADLWEALGDVIPSFIRRFDVDGAVLDMSHALPERLRTLIIAKARKEKESFLFIEENFTRDEESSRSGFDAVLGDVWWHASSIGSLSACLARHASLDGAVPTFVALDTHNTPRCATRLPWTDISAAYAMIMASTAGIPMILAGSEFGETVPMNTGLLFGDDDLRAYPASRLALFSAVRMRWEDADVTLLGDLRRMIAARIGA